MYRLQRGANDAVAESYIVINRDLRITTLVYLMGCMPVDDGRVQSFSSRTIHCRQTRPTTKSERACAETIEATGRKRPVQRRLHEGSPFQIRRASTSCASVKKMSTHATASPNAVASDDFMHALSDLRLIKQADESLVRKQSTRQAIRPKPSTESSLGLGRTRLRLAFTPRRPFATPAKRGREPRKKKKSDEKMTMHKKHGVPTPNWPLL